MQIQAGKTLFVVREKYDKEWTQGRMFYKGAFIAHTCEDVVRSGEKVMSRTAIPGGVYALGITMSNKFKRAMPLIYDVPNFEGIRIHGGNTAADTAGCILVAHTVVKPGHIWKTAENEVRNLIEQEGIRYIVVVDTSPPLV